VGEGEGAKTENPGANCLGFSGERPSVASTEAEAVTAFKAAAVVQQVLVDRFAQTGAYCTTRGGTDQCAQDQLSNRAGG